MIDENKRAVAFLRSNLHMQQSKAVAFAQENRTLRDELAGERDTRARLEDELRVCRDRLTAAESAKATLGERLSSFEEEEIILRTACDAEMKARRTETRARATGATSAIEREELSTLSTTLEQSYRLGLPFSTHTVTYIHQLSPTFNSFDLGES